MKIAMWITLFVLIVSTYAQSVTLNVKESNGIVLNINSGSLTITFDQSKEIAEPKSQESDFQSALQYCGLIGFSAVLGHYIIQKYIAQNGEKARTVGAVSHATFEMDNVTYVLLKCNDEDNAGDQLSSYGSISTDTSETGETYV
uniref:Conjugal transfer protein TraH n=1 Tax=Caenorhabditis tropicalis TaxID=1561998 RepID=A0A1I7T0D9_9PELO